MQNHFWIKLVFILTGIIFNGFSISYASKLISASSNKNMSGVQLWADNCSRCHNARSPTEFTPNQWNTIMLHMRIQGGLTGQEAKAVQEYLIEASLSEFKTVTTASTNQQDTQSNASGKTAITSSGKAVYQKTCIACHGADGKGIGPSFPDFTKKGGVLTHPSGVLLNNIKQGIGSMPAKGGNPNLSDEDLKAALDYIKNTFAK